MSFRAHLPNLIGSTVLLLALGLAGWRQANPPWARYQADPRVRTLVPTISDEPELCLTCHFGIEEISGSHSVDVFGCVVCHGGDPLSLDDAQAHQGLLGPGGNPSDLSAVEQACGTAGCHGGELPGNRNHIARLQRSLHTTYAGAINSVLQAYDLAAAPHGLNPVQALEYGPPHTVDVLLGFAPDDYAHPAVRVFAEGCLSCHVNAAPIQAPYFYRATGCAACHVPYANSGQYEGNDPTIPRDEPGHPTRHTLTLLIPSAQCAHCHVRGAYAVDDLSFTPRDPHTLTGERATDYQPHRDPTATVCERALDCIDCHNALEAMGDGYLYLRTAATPLVECRTCHGTLTSPPPRVTLDDPNDPAFRRANLNANYFVYEGDTVLVAPNGAALGAVRQQQDGLVLTSRLTGRTYRVPLVQGSACEQAVDQQEARDCRECHGTP